MDHISYEMIESVWDEFLELEGEDIREMLETMQREQPTLLAYMLASGEQLRENEHEDLVFLGMLVWQIFRHAADGELPEVTEELLDKVAQENTDMIAGFSEESEGDFVVSAESTFKTYNQSEVLGVVVEEIIENDELSEEAKGFMLMVLKTIIDCFDQ